MSAALFGSIFTREMFEKFGLEADKLFHVGICAIFVALLHADAATQLVCVGIGYVKRVDNVARSS